LLPGPEYEWGCIPFGSSIADQSGNATAEPGTDDVYAFVNDSPASPRSAVLTYSGGVVTVAVERHPELNDDREFSSDFSEDFC
jgi:hypothetical protein